MIWPCSRFNSVDRIHTSCVGSFFSVHCTSPVSGVAFFKKKKVTWLSRLWHHYASRPREIASVPWTDLRFCCTRAPPLPKKGLSLSKIYWDSLEETKTPFGKKWPSSSRRKTSFEIFFSNLKTLQFIFPSHRGRPFILLSLLLLSCSPSLNPKMKCDNFRTYCLSLSLSRRCPMMALNNNSF